MRSIAGILLSASILLSTPALAHTFSDQAQNTATASETKPAETYKLTFVVTELVKGKVEGRRSYSSLLFSAPHMNGHIRAGNRVPISTGSMNAQFQYIDVGSNFDFRTLEQPAQVHNTQQLYINVSAEVSSYVDPPPTSTLHQPIIRQQKWDSDFAVDISKPTLLFSSDDPTVDQTTQVELTVTKVRPE